MPVRRDARDLDGEAIAAGWRLWQAGHANANQYIIDPNGRGEETTQNPRQMPVQKKDAVACFANGQRAELESHAVAADAAQGVPP